MRGYSVLEPKQYKRVTLRSIALTTTKVILLVPLLIILAPLAILLDYWVSGIQAEYYDDDIM